MDIEFILNKMLLEVDFASIINETAILDNLDK